MDNLALPMSHGEDGRLDFFQRLRKLCKQKFVTELSKRFFGLPSKHLFRSAVPKHDPAAQVADQHRSKVEDFRLFFEHLLRTLTLSDVD